MGEVTEDTFADLEDGEIESDGEDASASQIELKPEENTVTPEPVKPEEPQQKESKKKKSKNHNNKDENKANKGKDKNKKNKFPGPVEDDFAGNIEKAIRKALKNEEEEEEAIMEVEEENGEPEARRKTKKRKKHDGSGSGKKRRRRKHPTDEPNDEEMMFTRGASPVRRSASPYDNYRSDDSYPSDGSFDEPRNHHSRPQRNRPIHFKERKNNKNNRDRRRDNMHPMQDPDGVCVYFMQGKCHKGDECAFSHDAQPPRKMELCKFYLMDCCAKRDKCLYMHADFPCKYYHTGLPCIFNDDCKFAHGLPLTDNLKSILLKHIESAPKEILGDFPRLSRESAAMMVANTQMRLVQQFLPGSMELKDRGIPSIFELNVPKPNNSDEPPNPSTQPLNQFSNDKQSHNKNTQKVRQSRWQNSGIIPNLAGNPLGNPDVLSIKNLTGVLTPQQIADLTQLGIENLNQLSQLTVNQLNHLGLNLKQINEIQLNTMSIQKLGLINGGESQTSLPSFSSMISANKDFDMRVPPMAPEVVSNPVVPPSEGKDVDMRLQPPVTRRSNNTSTSNETKEAKSIDPRANKDTIDIDQYTKDALKFALKEKENIDNMSSDFHENEELALDIPKVKDIDQRVLQYVKDVPVTSVSESDTDIRFLQPDKYHRKAEKRHRRSTTDDEDNNLLIDEKWYSSDEEKCSRTKSPKMSPRPSTPPTLPPTIEPSSVLNRLGDLSKIDISDEVTKLLTTMKNNLQENKVKPPSPPSEHSKPRDPRSLPKKSPDHKSPSTDLNKIIPHRKSSRVSIYECVEGEPTDGRKRIDVDLRQLDQDFRLPDFGDTDLRQTSSSGDIDFRFGLPFKPLPNYTPATEIDGSINCHPPIAYKLKVIDIPRPDYTDIKNSTAKSQAMADPRLRKLFRLSIDESSSDGEKSARPLSAPRADPRRKPSAAEIIDQKPASLDLQNVTNSSAWYKELSTNQKIFVNQQLATVTSLLKKYQQEKHLGKRFDVSQILNNAILCSIFNNLGVTVDDAGDISYINKESLLKAPPAFNPNPEAYGGNVMEGLGMMNVPQMGNMGPMGNMNMNPMSGYNGPFPTPDPRAAPGLLGIAPNMPHSFDNPNFGSPNFGPDGFHGNMSFNNAPGNDFGNMDGDQGYHRNQSRGNYRGRGNDRWNRGGNNRGNRDRRNYNERGSGTWKSERH